MNDLSRSLWCFNPRTGKSDGSFCVWEGGGKCLKCQAADEIERLTLKLDAYRELFDAAEAVRHICHKKGFDGIDECSAHRRMELAQGKVAELEGMARCVNSDGSVTLHAADAGARFVERRGPDNDLVACADCGKQMPRSGPDSPAAHSTSKGYICRNCFYLPPTAEEGRGRCQHEDGSIIDGRWICDHCGHDVTDCHGFKDLRDLLPARDSEGTGHE